MVIGQRLRELREAKSLSQGQIEERTGLLRCYTSRVENGHTIPSLDTLEKYARAFEVPLYILFVESDQTPARPTVTNRPLAKTRSIPRQEMLAFAKVLSKVDERYLKVLLAMAVRMARDAKS